MKTRSRMIRVLKRDSSTERFDHAKLRRSLWQAMGSMPDHLAHADAIARAIGDYLRLSITRAVSSRALFEMALGALRFAGQRKASERMESHARRRRQARHAVIVMHESGQRSRWDRSWIIEQFRRRWRISRPAARALSSNLESRLLRQPALLSRQDVLDAVDELADQFGLTPWCLLAGVPAGNSDRL